jgi:hypothetical protein
VKTTPFTPAASASAWLSTRIRTPVTPPAAAPAAVLDASLADRPAAERSGRAWASTGAPGALTRVPADTNGARAADPAVVSGAGSPGSWMVTVVAAGQVACAGW